MNLNRDAEALQSFREVIALDPRYDEAFYNIGWILKGSDKASAKSAFMKAIELDGKYAGAHRELGWILRQEKQFGLAEQHLRRAVELNPADSWAWLYFGNFFGQKVNFRAQRMLFGAATITPRTNGIRAGHSLVSTKTEETKKGQLASIIKPCWFLLTSPLFSSTMDDF